MQVAGWLAPTASSAGRLVDPCTESLLMRCVGFWLVADRALRDLCCFCAPVNLKET
jgi:hypothetical protein